MCTIIAKTDAHFDLYIRILGDSPQLLQIMLKEHWLDLILASGKSRIAAMVRTRTSASAQSCVSVPTPSPPLWLSQGDIIYLPPLLAILPSSL